MKERVWIMQINGCGLTCTCRDWTDCDQHSGAIHSKREDIVGQSESTYNTVNGKVCSQSKFDDSLCFQA